MMGGGMENYRSHMLISVVGNGSTIPGEAVSTPKPTMLGAAFGSADSASSPSVPTIVPSVSDMQLLMRELDPETAEEVSSMQSK
jgi:hypothetical protein